MIELKNESPNPERNLWVERRHIDEFGKAAAATWHTHPKNNVNLSATDHQMFLSLPHLDHYIVTQARVRKFVVRGGKVLLDEADCL